MKIGIIGASGISGVSLIQLLIKHPHVSLEYLTSEKNKGEYISHLYPSLKNITDKKFEPFSIGRVKDCDFIFVALPHTKSMEIIGKIKGLGKKIVDLSSDFRIKDYKLYEEYYSEHTEKELNKHFVYGLPELNKDNIKNAQFVSNPGCNATSIILALFPLIKEGVIDGKVIVDIKVGASGSGKKLSESSLFLFRSNVIRPHKLLKYRHLAEIKDFIGNGLPDIYLSTYSVDLVRGVLSSIYITVKEGIDSKRIWKIYRQYYKDSPFIRFISGGTDFEGYPNPKLNMGSNFCDIGFKMEGKELVVLSSLDNLMKGAAGQAVQNMNLMLGFDEKTGIDNIPIYPI